MKSIQDQAQEQAIAKGKILGYLLMSKNPLALNMQQLCDRLHLTPAEATAALKGLEEEQRIELTITRAIVSLIEIDSPPESSRLDALPEPSFIGGYPEEADTPSEVNSEPNAVATKKGGRSHEPKP